MLSRITGRILRLYEVPNKRELNTWAVDLDGRGNWKQLWKMSLLLNTAGLCATTIAIVVSFHGRKHASHRHDTFKFRGIQIRLEIGWPLGRKCSNKRETAHTGRTKKARTTHPGKTTKARRATKKGPKRRNSTHGKDHFVVLPWCVVLAFLVLPVLLFTLFLFTLFLSEVLITCGNVGIYQKMHYACNM